MIAYIKGKILAKKGDFLIVEQQGIGYKIFVSQKTQAKLKKGQEKEFFTHFCVRNERPELYGFLRMDELEIFELIEKISGIGPKGALLIASLGAIDELKKAVKNQDFKYFSKIKGIGTKKVQKIVLELGGSLRELTKDEPIEKDDEALKGLRALGFSVAEARKALEKVPKEITEPEKRIQKALQMFGKK